MEDETPAVEEPTQSDNVAPAVNDESTDDGAGQNETPVEKMFTQADLDRIVKDRLDRAQRRADEAAAKAAAEAQRKADEEQGKYKELYESLQAELSDRDARIQEMERATWRAEAARKHNLPEALANRLQGESLEEMIEDAKAMADALPKPTAPNINGVAGNGASPRKGMTNQALTEMAARYGLQPSTLIELYGNEGA